MSYDLTGQKVSFTYGRVVQVVSGSYYDGFGNVLPIGTSSVVTASTAGFATTGSNIFIGNQTISGSLIVTNGITGSLYGTSSWANNVISSSYATTASYALNAGGGTTLITGSTYPITSSWSNNTISASYALTASYATTASYALNSLTASYAATASYYNGSVISSSYSLSASYAPTNANLTASYAILASVSSSLNFTDDVAAAAGGVPLGGLYRNGNFILIRLS
jgi:hypothetical protein